MSRAACFGGVPVRACGDKRLTGLHLKVLVAIAAHYRFKANGQGSWAGHPRLAALCGCHLKSLSRILRDLVEWGYIEVSTNPTNRKRRIYTVLYADEDLEWFRSYDAKNAASKSQIKPNPPDAGIGNKRLTYVDADTDEIGNTEVTEDELLSPPISSEPITQLDEIGNLEAPEKPDNTLNSRDKTNPNILCETYKK